MNERFNLFEGNCLEVMKTMEADSIDSIVTDPPYELGFMGKSWDSSGIAFNVEVWQEALRVLKPGGHLIAFSGSRTYHRMAVAIEDAGFEIRDQIMWVYGSGFPKSHDVSKGIDKQAGAEREVVGKMANPASSIYSQSENEMSRDVPITAPSTDAAKEWEGWGTALKPALEPITVARKPLIGTVAENVLQHGTGAINVDGGRVGFVSDADRKESTAKNQHADFGTQPMTNNNVYGDYSMIQPANYNPPGRWPANFIHDGSEEATDLLKDSARFFYCAKASKADRGENHHPTVKPTDLMRYLCRLITPPNGIVLDPFNGSGSTGCAAVLEGFQYIGIEREAEYIAISEKRIQARSKQVQEQPKQLTLL